MNFDPFASFTCNPPNKDKAFKVTLELFSVMPHSICSGWSGDQPMHEQPYHGVQSCKVFQDCSNHRMSFRWVIHLFWFCLMCVWKRNKGNWKYLFKTYYKLIPQTYPHLKHYSAFTVKQSSGWSNFFIFVSLYCGSYLNMFVVKIYDGHRDLNNLIRMDLFRGNNKVWSTKRDEMHIVTQHEFCAKIINLWDLNLLENYKVNDKSSKHLNVWNIYLRISAQSTAIYSTYVLSVYISIQTKQ